VLLLDQHEQQGGDPAAAGASKYDGVTQRPKDTLGAILDQPLATLDYPDRQARVQAAGLAIWDVYAACMREGSLDAAIRQGQANDLAGLAALAPGLQRVCFNGRTAARFERLLSSQGYEVRVLPSTSPANAGWSFERKLAAWREALG